MEVQKLLGIVDFIFGVFVVILQVATYITFANSPYLHEADLISSGIWCGISFMTTGFLAASYKQRFSVGVAAVISTLCSVAMLGLYCWHIDAFVDQHSLGFYCTNSECKGRIAIDSMFIISGIVCFLVNATLIVRLKTAKSSHPEEISRRFYRP